MLSMGINADPDLPANQVLSVIMEAMLAGSESLTLALESITTLVAKCATVDEKSYCYAEQKLHSLMTDIYK